MLVLGSLALSDGEKFRLQGSDSDGRQLKGVKKSKEKKAEKSSYKKSVGYHEPGDWLIYSYYQRAQNLEKDCEHLTSAHGYPEGVCANYYQNTDFNWMNYAGQSKEDIILMWSYFTDRECKNPATGEIPSGPFPFPIPAQGALAHPKGCQTTRDVGPGDTRRLQVVERNLPEIYSVQDKTPRYEGGVLFNTFPTPDTCAANDIGSTFEFWFNKYDACGQIASNSAFLKGIADTTGQIIYGVMIVECNDDHVSFDVYRSATISDSVLCQSDATIDRVTFKTSDTCKGGQTNGVVNGGVNYKCI